jgi:SAM-dependent methyltransferase
MMQRLRHIAQFALPVGATLAVAGAVGDEVLRLRRPPAVHFPQRPTALDATDEELIMELEGLRTSRGIGYLLVPASSYPWVESHPDLDAHITSSCRLVLDEPQSARLFAIQDVEDPTQDNPALDELDGMPLPPIEMIRLTTGMNYRVDKLPRAFYREGQRGAAWISDALGKHGRAMADFRSVLDFGCGCGRVIRHWKSIEGPEYHGSDLNDYMIRWASENLPFAEFTVNGDTPPLAYEDKSFDLVYTISVFTHLLEPLQREWAVEMGRLIAPGGMLILTTHGPQMVASLDEDARRAFGQAGGQESFDAGERIVIRPEGAGTNALAAFHPESYVRDVLAPAAEMEVVDYLPMGATDAHQDAFVLVK